MYCSRAFSYAFALCACALVELSSASLLIREPEPHPPAADSPRPRAAHFNARLHHFDASVTDQFAIKFYYQLNESTYTDNVLVLVGGPWSISEGWLRSSLVTDLAHSLGGLATFYLEHRFYGDSIPSGDSDLNNLRYLTADQSLGDIAQFIQHIKSNHFQNGTFSHAKVTLLGCSVGGTLSTWMRLGYPHLVQYAVSDSGPLQTTEQFPEFLELVSARLRREGGDDCYKTLEEGITSVRANMRTAEGRRLLAELFGTNVPESEQDISSFYWYTIIETIATFVQNSNSNDVRRACDQMTGDNSQGDALQRLVAFISAHRLDDGFSTNAYNTIIDYYRNVSNASPHRERRVWLYQACAQYGWHQTTSAGGLFHDTVADDYFKGQCRDVFGNLFSDAFISASIQRANLFFAGVSHIPDYVISATTDPWSPVSPRVDRDNRTLSPVYHINGFGQCQVIRPLLESEQGLEEVHRVKLSIQGHLLHWIRDIDTNAATALAHSALTVMIGLALFKLMF